MSWEDRSITGAVAQPVKLMHWIYIPLFRKMARDLASLRWRLNTIQNWSYAKGMYLKVKHSNPEQHTFRIILKDTTCEQVRGANFKNVFSNPNQVDEPIMIPFQVFDQMEQMGHQLRGSLFNRGSVTELGLMSIKLSVVGEFELVVKEWGLSGDVGALTMI